MPSAAHQTLLLWAARKMAHDGFRISGYDGESMQGGIWNSLGPPPIIRGVRPDAWAFDGIRIAFAEAKTSADIDTAHTRLQLETLVWLRDPATGTRCRLYVAIPRSAAPLLDRALSAAGIVGRPEVVRLHVPDILLRGVA
jgi:hypothetical protein